MLPHSVVAHLVTSYGDVPTTPCAVGCQHFVNHSNHRSSPTSTLAGLQHTAVTGLKHKSSSVFRHPRMSTDHYTALVSGEFVAFVTLTVRETTSVDSDQLASWDDRFTWRPAHLS